ncbi:TerC family protein [Paenibacillus urinalis]|uniref:TerC family protein n=2 Tax=Bacteria TaxID=2 RepID=A0AAX3MW26_9BACL|nr:MULTISPECIES: TerC family protein [Paenibacillus]WDH81553.1 TerC family protein [Paenibacillus urinalis]WDH97598.1 TerC family protein [Paenibacillus urinalis]WDI01268.1 TerC family protein [Paenibacillus urinalis]GAK39664.1 hypothetical protein TCA2_2153 [Paenibacillus sp. TCA20]
MDIGQFLISLLQIVFIDLILAGDNAIVIGLAARNLPQSVQKKAIVYGTGGAVLIRILATIIVLWLLQIPWLLLVAGLLLVGIAYKLLADQGADEHSDIKAGSSLWSAVRTIIIADAAMGIDNVIAVAGAAEQNLILVILGLLISVPVIVWGSTLFIKLIDRFPWVMYIGAAVLAYTASNMITEERRFETFFISHPVLRILFIVLVIGGVLFAGYRKQQNMKREHSYS